MIRSTMQRVPLSINQILERAGKLYPESEIVSRLPDKSLARHRFADFYRRSRALASALIAVGLKKGDRVATLCWNHYAHLECYFGIPAAGGVMHTLNLRLVPDEIGWIANHAQDRFLIVDDVLLPLYEQFKALAPFEKVIVVPLSRRVVSAPLVDYEALLDGAPARFDYAPHEEDDPIAMCYTSGTTGRPKGVVYSHRSTVIHTLMANQPDHWGLSARDSVMPATPMFHANCWGVPYVCAMMGIKLGFPGPHLAPEDLLDLMAREKPTYALGVPTIWLGMLQLLDAQSDRYKLPPGMRMLVGGAPVPESLVRAYARHGAAVSPGWGMTEMSPLGTLSFIKPELLNASEDERFARLGMAGVPVPIMDIRIIGGDGCRAALGRQERRRDPGARTVHRRRVPRRDARPGEVLRRRLAAHGRRRDDRPPWLRAHHRPREGLDQVGRRVDQLGRHGEPADGASGGAGGRGDRDRGCEVGRAAARLRRAQGRQDRFARRVARPSWRQAREVAVARPIRVSRRDSAHLYGQVLEGQAAGAVSLMRCACIYVDMVAFHRGQYRHAPSRSRPSPRPPPHQPVAAERTAAPRQACATRPRAGDRTHALPGQAEQTHVSSGCGTH